MEHKEKVKMHEIEDQAFKNYLKIKEVNFKFNCFIIGLFLLVCMQGHINYKKTERLNEQKRLLIAQQEQINKLILNAEYNTLRYEKTVR